MNNKCLFKTIFLLFFINPIFGKISLSSDQSELELSTANSVFNNADSTLTFTNGQMVFYSGPTTQLTGSALNIFNSPLLTSAGQIIGQYSLSSTSLTLTGTQNLYLGGGSTALPTINVSGVNNAIYGCGILTNPITLANSSAVLIMQVSSAVDSLITLNGGTLQLNCDLNLGSGQIVGPGTVNLNNHALFLAPQTNTTALTFSTGGRLIFKQGAHTLSGTWTLGSTGAFRLVGQESNLTLSSGGSIIFTTTTQSGLDYMNIFGLNSSLGQVVTFGGGQFLTAYGCRFVLTGNYTQTTGILDISDNRCIFCTNGYTYTLPTGAALATSGCIIFFDNLSSSQTSPFATTGGGLVYLSNGGLVRSITRTDGTTGTAGTAGANNAGAVGNISITAASTTFASNNRCDKYRTITFTNNTPATPFAFTFNGNGQKLICENSANPNLILTQNSQVTFSNMLIESFNPASVSPAPSAYIVFGTGCLVDLVADMVLDSSSPVWYASINPIICGSQKNNVCLELRADNKITVNASSTLTLQNLRIKIRTPNPFNITTGSTLIFDNCTIWQDQDFYFATGNVQWNLYNSIAAETSFSSPLYMHLTGTGTMTVNTDATLEFTSGTGMIYNPSITSDLNSFYRMRHFMLTAYNSKLVLNGATLQSTATGLSLDQGHIFIKNNSSLISQGTGPFALTIANTTVIDIQAGAVLDLTGTLIVN